MARQRKPVSGPGKLSQRTDLAQPIRAPTGGPYGQRKQLEAAQRVQPLPNVVGGAGAQTGTPPGPAASIPATNVFAPTQRPLEPVTAGAPVGAGPNGPLAMYDNDIEKILQVIYEITRSPAVLRLMNVSR